MSPSPPAAAPGPDPGGLRTFQIVAAQDRPFYGAFTVTATDPDAALVQAKARLFADPGVLADPEPEGAHSLRILALQEGDQDPLFADVALDPDAPFWPGREVRDALLATTAALAQLVASLGEAEAYPDALDRLAANLRLLHLDCEGAARLAQARSTEAPEAWVEQVMHWAWSQMAGAAR